MSGFSTFMTITGRKLRVRPNPANRTYTIKTETNTFRTLKMSKEEFDSCKRNTGNDWQQFLNQGAYYKVER